MQAANFHAERLTGIGASDTPIIMGLSRFQTPYELWQVKTGAVDAATQEENEAMRWGHILEQPIALEYALRQGVMVWLEQPLHRHAEHEWLFCHPDAKTDDNGLVQIKNFWAGAEGWREDEEIPDDVMAQEQHELLVTGADYVDVAVLLGGQRLAIKRILPDPEYQKRIFDAAMDFWFNHVQTKTPPAVTSPAEARLRWPQSEARSVEATTEIAFMLEELTGLKATAKAAQGRVDDVQAQVMEHMGEAEVLTYGGKILATWKTSERKGYTVAPSTSRTFLVKK